MRRHQRVQGAEEVRRESREPPRGQVALLPVLWSLRQDEEASTLARSEGAGLGQVSEEAAGDLEPSVGTDDTMAARALAYDLYVATLKPVEAEGGLDVIDDMLDHRRTIMPLQPHVHTSQPVPR